MYRILMADDEKMALLSSERSLPLADYHMTAPARVCDSFEALHLLENRYFDAAFLDIRMPGLSGLDIIDRLIRQPFCPVFIVVSGYSDFEYMKRAIQFGAFDYCLKPIQSEEASALLRRLEPVLYQNRLKNGPLILERLSDPETQEQTFLRCGLTTGEHPLTIAAAALPSCQNLLPYLNGSFFPLFLNEQKALLLSDAAPTAAEEEIQQLLAIPDCRLAVGNFDRNAGRLDRLISQLETDLLLTGPETPVIRTVAVSPNDAFQRLLEEVRQGYAEDLSLQELARKYNLSYSYCSELFKTVTGLTFSKYLTQLRMNTAAQLLLADNHSVTEIAYQVGYHNYHHFVVMFKSFFGLTPTEYRQKEGTRQ